MSAQFRILGPIEVWDGDQRLPLGGPRQIALFALLLLNANRAVASEVLGDALWGPARSGSDNRLQMAIARLRKALSALDGPAGPVVRTVRGGYLLAVASGQLDAEEFAAAVKSARQALEDDQPDLATGAIRQGLALWRGPPLAEVAFEDFAQAEIRRLEELRLTAIETRVDAELALGRQRDLIGELEALALEHPSRERIAAQLMIALYRSDRQADALEVYQRTRNYLTEQLGLEPGPALKRLQSQILEQAGSLEQRSSDDPRLAPAQVRAPLPSRLERMGPRSFIDRQAERAAIAQALLQTTSSGPRSVVVTGEPGIGKTRLVTEAAFDAHEAGAVVLLGRCAQDADLPYQPFVEALEHLVQSLPSDVIEAHRQTHGDSLSRLVPALARGRSETPSRSSQSERYVLFRAIEALFSTASSDRLLVLVLEDLHWADLPTLELLRRLLNTSRHCPLLALLTCRVADLPEDHPLRALLADAHRDPRSVRLELSGLEGHDLADLVRGAAADPPDHVEDGLVSALSASTSGNPFLITELVRGLEQSGTLAIADGEWQLSPGADIYAGLPVSIKETLAKRVGQLDRAVRSTLRAAAVLGEEFDIDAVSELCGPDAAADALERARRAGVIATVPGPPGRLRFSHTLTHRYLYREQSAAVRAAMHRRVAATFETRPGQRRMPAAELARHWLASGEANAGHALPHAVKAGEEALDKLAPDEAARWFQIALDLIDRLESRDESQVCEVLIKLGESQRQAGDPEFRSTLLHAAQLARMIGDDQLLVRAVLANSRGMQSETGTIDQARIGMAGAALEAVGDGESATRARLLAIQAAELMYSPDWERRLRLSDDALAMARRLDDAETLSTVLNMRFVTLLAPHTHNERAANASESVAIAHRLNDPIARFYAYHWRGYTCIESGEIATARAWIEREREIAERFRHPTALWLSRADQANLAIIAGELDDATALTAEALEIGQRSEPDALACFAAQQTSIAFEAGRLGELVPMLEQAVDLNPGVPGFRATLALALAQSDRGAEARALLASAGAHGFQDLAYDVTWLAVACIYAHVSASLGERTSSRALYELLEPWHMQIAFPAFGVWGPVSLYLGSLALTIGDHVDAEHWLAQAAHAAQRADAPLWHARVKAQQRRVPQPVR